MEVAVTVSLAVVAVASTKVIAMLPASMINGGGFKKTMRLAVVAVAMTAMVTAVQLMEMRKGKMKAMASGSL
jgi:hypothetical protein